MESIRPAGKENVGWILIVSGCLNNQTSSIVTDAKTIVVVTNAKTKKKEDYTDKGLVYVLLLIIFIIYLHIIMSSSL